MSNIIEIPMIKFKFFGYDEEDNGLFILSDVIDQEWMS